MAFGFSVGDFVAVGKLICDITASLNDTGGAKSEYQELIRELETLHKVLKHIDSLRPSSEATSSHLPSIKYAALSCRQPLEEFLSKIRNYEQSLGVWAKRDSVQSAVGKLKWTFGQKNDVQKLQHYLNLHVGVINMLLAEYGLVQMNIVAEKTEAGSLQIREMLESTQAILHGIKDSVSAQSSVVRVVQSMLTNLYQIVNGEIMSSWSSLRDMVAKVYFSTQQIYGVVLEIKASVSTVDTRWTFFQAPLIVEDLFGVKIPVPSEYDYGMLENIIQYRFREGEGSFYVKCGNYELFKAKNSGQVISHGVRLFPGTEITMGVVVNKWDLYYHDELKCPRPYCPSTQTVAAPEGGRICCTCKTWISETQRPFKYSYLIHAIKNIHAQDRFIISASGGDDIDDHLERPDSVHASEIAATLKPGGARGCWQNFKNFRYTQAPALADEVNLLKLYEIEIPAGTAHFEALANHPVDGIQQTDHRKSRKPTYTDEFSFLYYVRYAYRHNPSINDNFLRVLVNYLDDKPDIPGVWANLYTLSNFLEDVV